MAGRHPLGQTAGLGIGQFTAGVIKDGQVVGTDPCREKHVVVFDDMLNLEARLISEHPGKHGTDGRVVVHATTAEEQETAGFVEI